MPTTDPTFGWPIPEDTDALADGAAAIRALAAGIADTLQLMGAHGTWTRNSGQDRNGDGYLSFSGANLSEAPSGIGFSGDNNGLVIPFRGVFLLHAQVKWEGSSQFDRAEFQLRQGPLGGEIVVSAIQVKHEPGTGSEQVTISGRASVMDPGDYVRIYTHYLDGSSGRLSQARVHAAYIGQGQ